MNRKEATKLLPIIQAYAEGKEIEIFDKTMKMWKTAMLPHFDCDSNIYRIKPESKYRPFKNAEECLDEMLKHQPFEWVKSRCAFFHIIYIEDKFVGYGSACGTIQHDNFNDALENFTFADGIPFGVKVEE